MRYIPSFSRDELMVLRDDLLNDPHGRTYDAYLAIQELMALLDTLTISTTPTKEANNAASD